MTLKSPKNRVPKNVRFFNMFFLLHPRKVIMSIRLVKSFNIENTGIPILCDFIYDASEMLKNEKHGQFAFQRWQRRQNRTFLAPYGSTCFLAKNHRFDENSRITAKVAEIAIFCYLYAN